MPIPAELQSLLSELKISPPTKEHAAVETVEALVAAVPDMGCSFSKNLLIKDKKAGQMVKVPVCGMAPARPLTPPRGAPGGSGWRALPGRSKYTGRPVTASGA